MAEELAEGKEALAEGNCDLIVSALDVKVQHPAGVAVIPNGHRDIVMCDYSNKRVLIISDDGHTSRQLPGSFAGPSGVTVLKNGNFLIADYSRNVMEICAPDDGKVITQFTGLHHPCGVAELPTGEFAVAEYNGRILAFSVDTTSRILLEDKSSNFYGLHVYREEFLIACQLDCLVFLEFDGSLKRKITPLMPSALPGIHGAATLNDGNLIICDTANGRLFVVTLDGVVVREIGRSGSVKPEEFNRPLAVAAAEDMVVVSDNGNHQVKIVLGLNDSSLTKRAL